MKTRNKILCEVCHEGPAKHKHHKFPNTKKNRELYGKLLDHELNILHVCIQCHLWKPSHNKEKLLRWNEIQFCTVSAIEPRSKSGQEVREIK